MASITEHFKYLGAPLANQRWSWGGVRDSDGAVFLRAWQDQIKTLEPKRHYVLVADRARYGEEGDGSPGHQERLEHLDRIRAGATAYVVMCINRAGSGSPRQIESFQRREVWRGGELVEIDGDTFIELGERERIG